MESFCQTVVVEKWPDQDGKGGKSLSPFYFGIVPDLKMSNFNEDKSYYHICQP